MLTEGSLIGVLLPGATKVSYIKIFLCITDQNVCHRKYYCMLDICVNSETFSLKGGYCHFVKLRTESVVWARDLCTVVISCAKLGEHRLVQNVGAHLPNYVTSQVTSVELTALESQSALSHSVLMVGFASMYKIGLGLEGLMCTIKNNNTT